MGKYPGKEEFFDELDIQMAIANELAEANRLKRIELQEKLHLLSPIEDKA